MNQEYHAITSFRAQNLPKELSQESIFVKGYILRRQGEEQLEANYSNFICSRRDRQRELIMRLRATRAVLNGAYSLGCKALAETKDARKVD